jgi:exopolysaccharide biosynthesis polyprenyl glycosylphosphotransferase
MLKEQARAVDAGLKVFDLAVLGIAFPAAYLLRDQLFGTTLAGLYSVERYWPLIALSLLLWLAASSLVPVYEAYRTRSLWVEIGRLVRAMALVALAATALGYMTHDYEVSRLFIALYFAVALAMLTVNRLIVRLVARAARRRGYNLRRFAVAGSGRLAREVVASVERHREWGIEFAGYIVEDDGPEEPLRAPVLGHMGQLGRILEREVVDEVYFAIPRERMETIEKAVKVCEELGVGAKVCVSFIENHIGRAGIEELDSLPFLSFSTTPSDMLALAAKRALDVVVSAAALLMLSPVFAVVAAAIRLESRGPVFFRQRRVGMNGREFFLFKFRSMAVDAEQRLAALRTLNEASGPVFKMRDDPRVTRVGRFIRKASIDELPQFWNVFKGEMSIVGPRPPIPSEVRQYEAWQRRRLSMRPGITCVWQISGRSDIDFNAWMDLDLQYIDNWSLWEDVKIFFKTIPVVLIGKGAR